MRLFASRRVYLDYASAPPVHPEAVQAMRDAAHVVGNPGAIHKEGVAAKAALDGARARIAAQLNVKAREVVFTSGLTESNNLAVLGLARAREISGTPLTKTHWVVSAIEHDSVLHAFAEVERLGGRVSFVQPDQSGVVQPEKVRAALQPETVLVSVGWANNETGVLQPLSQIARVLGPHTLLHSDAGQAPLYEATTAHSLGVDLLSLGGNKLYGPHGIGALFVSNRATLLSHTYGGGQERGLRAGTESVALAEGFAAAYEAIAKERARESVRLKALRDHLLVELKRAVPSLVVNGRGRILPHMLHISIPHIQSEYVALALDARGYALSTKSACREGEEPESHVIRAMVGPEDAWRAATALRISLGRDTRAADLRAMPRALAAACESGRTR